MAHAAWVWMNGDTEVEYEHAFSSELERVYQARRRDPRYRRTRVNVDAAGQRYVDLAYGPPYRQTRRDNPHRWRTVKRITLGGGCGAADGDGDVPMGDADVGPEPAAATAAGPTAAGATGAAPLPPATATATATAPSRWLWLDAESGDWVPFEHEGSLGQAAAWAASGASAHARVTKPVCVADARLGIESELGLQQQQQQQQ